MTGKPVCVVPATAVMRCGKPRPVKKRSFTAYRLRTKVYIKPRVSSTPRSRCNPSNPVFPRLGGIIIPGPTENVNGFPEIQDRINGISFLLFAVRRRHYDRWESARLSTGFTGILHFCNKEFACAGGFCHKKAADAFHVCCRISMGISSGLRPARHRCRQRDGSCRRSHIRR